MTSLAVPCDVTADVPAVETEHTHVLRLRSPPVYNVPPRAWGRPHLDRSRQRADSHRLA